MSSLHEFLTLMPSPLCTPARRPIEVDACESPLVGKEAMVATTPVPPVARPHSSPTRDEMIAAFRAMRDRRRNADEADVVLDKIVGDNSPGSLIGDTNKPAAE